MIAIKGMKMPDCCIECPLQYVGYCLVAPAEVDDKEVVPFINLYIGRATWCPLVEVKSEEGEDNA